MKLQVGFRIVSLELDRSGVQPQTVPRIWMECPRVGPVGCLVSVNPGRDVRTMRDHRQSEGNVVDRD